MMRAWALCGSLILLCALGQAKEEDNSQVACNTDVLNWPSTGPQVLQEEDLQHIDLPYRGRCWSGCKQKLLKRPQRSPNSGCDLGSVRLAPDQNR